MPMDLCSIFKPMKLVERADELMRYVEALFRDHEPNVRPDDCTLAKDQTLSAWDFRQGVEKKSWLARIEQAILKFDHAHLALDMVKKAVEIPVEIQVRSRKAGLYI